ncbi:MAG: GMP/IMP nucleotidase [Gammaproteobacteria bacterium]|nr:GMP/IMP nucleotidase [Gammaproteobacteria bacterium]
MSTSPPTIDWEQISSIFLDMDGTLLDLHFDDHFWQEFLPEQYANRHGLTIEQALEILQPRFKTKEGTLDWYCLDYWSRELGLDIPALKIEVAHLITIHDGVLDFLAFTRRARKRTVLLTNAHPKVLELKMQHTGLSAHFDNIISAHMLGHAKEEPHFWQKLQSLEPFEPRNTLFIDDSLPVLRSAARYGIKHLRGIAKPSSQKPPRTDHEFPMLSGFSEIVPTT